MTRGHPLDGGLDVFSRPSSVKIRASDQGGQLINAELELFDSIPEDLPGGQLINAELELFDSIPEDLPGGQLINAELELFDSIPEDLPGDQPRRRTNDAILAIKQVMYELLVAEHPMSVRQLFYRLVALGLIPKTEGQYRAVGRYLTQMRKDHLKVLAGKSPKGPSIPFEWITDSTRWPMRPMTFISTGDALTDLAKSYRRDPWADADIYIEIWLEKAALADLVYQETDKYGVPLMVSRGYSSTSFVAGAAKEIATKDKPVYVYYFGDHDPSGKDIPRAIEKGLTEVAPNADITFQTVAVTSEHIETYALPTRPPKPGDSRTRRFMGLAVDLDALPGDVLRRLVRECIERHVDQERLNALLAEEKSERERLQKMAGLFAS